MEKMNQVSVSEFMNLTKTQMYDNAVEMVEKYNRLVDICNDSAERMAEFMAKDDINEFKKELQSKAPGEFKIQKLADIAVWADGKIRDGGYNEEKYNNDGATAYCHVKAHELWKIKEVVLEAVNRHNTYTNALNQDIADKEAKIELLEKGLEGRKEGYTALKELMDTKYISIDEHNKIIDQFKEEVKKLNKCIMNKNESINTGNEAIINLRKEIGAHEEENARLSDIIKNLRASNEKLREEQNQYKEFVDGLKKDLNYWKEAFETQASSLAEVRKLNDELVDTLNKSSDEVEKLEKQVEYLKKELDQTCTCKELDLKGHQSRETALVNALADKNDEIKELKEEIEELKKKNFDDFKRRDTDIINQAKRICELEEELDRWKNKFEESRKETIDRNAKILCLEVNLKRWKDIAEHNMNDAYKKEIARLEKEIKQKQDVIKTAYERYSNEVIKTRKDLMEVAYRDIEKDNGYVGFKLYVKNTLTEAKGDKKEANEVITDAVKTVYAEWSKEEKEKDVTEVKGNGRTSSGRYPWGAKVNDIPCGSDSIE